MLPALGIEYSRVVGNTDGFAMPEDFLRWTSTCHHNHNLLQLGKQFLGLEKKQYLFMMYVWGHSYEFDNDNNWDLMEQFCPDDVQPAQHLVCHQHPDCGLYERPQTAALHRRRKHRT